MSECWNCNESQLIEGNYCGSCGSPQNPKMVAQRFMRDLEDLTRGFHGNLDLAGATGCQEMTAKGLAEHPEIDVSQETWEERFEPTPVFWIEEYLFRNWISYHDFSVDDLIESVDEYDLLEDEDTTGIGSLPDVKNTECSCGDQLPKNPPEMVTRWKEGVEASAVCLECFGEITNRLA